MSDEQGLYYEISLTSRQVLVGILLLLACVMVAFLSGVWIGRESSPELPTFAEAGETPADSAAVDFFDPEADVPPEGDSVGADASPQQEERRSEPPPERESPKLSRVIPAEPERESTGSSGPPASPADARGAGEATTESVPAGGPVVIQVFSSHDEKQAKAILDRLRNGGVRAFLSPVEVSGKTMHRVRVGPFNDRTLAESEAVMLRKQYRLDTWITQQDG